MNTDTDYCFVVPILPGRVDDVKDLWKEAGGNKAQEFDQYMRAIGQTRLLEFLQTLPGGNFLVTYVQEADDIGTTYGKNRTLDLPVARYIREKFIDFTGFDFTKPENAPKVEKVREWEDEKQTGQPQRRAAFGIPILPGKTNDVRRFFDIIRSGEAGDEAPIFRYQTVSKIESFLQQRPEGDYLVEYVESAEPIDAVMRKGLSTGEPISEFIRQGFSGFCALPLPLAPDIELLFDREAGKGGLTAATRTAQT